MKMSPLLRVVLVFGFMGLCIIQALTGFISDLVGREPWAFRLLSNLIHSVFLEPLGRIGGTVALVAVTAVMGVLAYRRGVRERLG